MLITSDRKSSPAKRLFMIGVFIAMFGTVWFTMIVDNASVPPTEQANVGPIRRLISLVLASGLICAGLYIIADITIFLGPMLVIGALFIVACRPTARARPGAGARSRLA